MPARLRGTGTSIMPLPEGLICTPPHLFPLHLDIAAHSTKVVSNFLSNYPLHLPHQLPARVGVAQAETAPTGRARARQGARIEAAELIGTTTKALQRKRERGIIPRGVWQMIDGRVMYSRGRYDAWVETPTFREYAQVWLNSREAVEGTRDNYKGTLNLYWMPHFATARIDEIGGADIRRGAETSWTSPGVRRNARDKMASVMESALPDGC